MMLAGVLLMEFYNIRANDLSCGVFGILVGDDNVMMAHPPRDPRKQSTTHVFAEELFFGVVTDDSPRRPHHSVLSLERPQAPVVYDQLRRSTQRTDTVRHILYGRVSGTDPTLVTTALGDGERMSFVTPIVPCFVCPMPASP